VAEDVPVAAPELPVDEAVAALAALPQVGSARREHGELVVSTTRGEALALLQALRDDMAFAQMMDVTAVDFPERAERFDLVYNLLSVTRNARVRVIVPIAVGASAESVSGLWPNATWWEREIWDLFGIPFEGLADHRRIVSDYGFEGHPLRKDFPLTGYLEVHYDEEQKLVVYDKVKLAQEFRNFDFLSPWEGMTTLPGDEKATGRAR